MPTRQQIINMQNKDEAYSLIDQQDEWSAKYKASVRYAWKQKHDSNSIIRCPAKGQHKKKTIDDKISCFTSDEDRIKKCKEIYDAKIQYKKELKEKIIKMQNEYNKLKKEIENLKEKYESSSTNKECTICMNDNKEFGDESDICQHFNDVCINCKEKLDSCPYCQTWWIEHDLGSDLDEDLDDDDDDDDDD